ncbi:6116_t:CDS:1 [Paraglomus occultum]|uniref:6116_t:CDS:1 n=1 Tax=Paraglomus occultum TaxID=144539 RepID=A0A9N9CZK4_9GLOM|nr:6116_t:CDS:1 [Paraglomus occultum]
MVRIRMKCDAPIFTPEDYSYIMQCRDIKPRYKILNELTDKYKTSTKRIYQIWRGVEANRVLWDQPIPYSYDNVSNFTSPTYQNTECQWQSHESSTQDISSANISNSSMNVLHIESKPLVSKSQNLENRLADGSVIDSVSVEPAQSSKRTKAKRSKSVRISDSPVISEDSTEKIDAETVAHLRHAIEGGKRNLTKLGYKIDET